jgi:hypothetical protein
MALCSDPSTRLYVFMSSSLIRSLYGLTLLPDISEEGVGVAIQNDRVYVYNQLRRPFQHYYIMVTYNHRVKSRVHL